MDKARGVSLKAQIARWWPALVMMAVIFAASSFPSQDLPNFGLWDWLLKKSGHALGYALLALAYLRGLTPAGGERPAARKWLLAVLLAGLYGATDEYHQSFVAGRGAAAADVLIDTLGAAIGVAVRVRVWS